MYKKKSARKRWYSYILRSALVAFLLIIGVDYGKHWFLKNILEKEMAKADVPFSATSVSLAYWPLFKIHVIAKNPRLLIDGISLKASEISFRQECWDWTFVQVKAKDIEGDQSIHIQESQGILKWQDFPAHICLENIILKQTRVQFPLTSFFIQEAFLDCLYETESHHLSLKGDMPKISSKNGVVFGLKGEGKLRIVEPFNGRFDLRINNIDQVLNELVALGLVPSTQANLLTAGSRFLGQLGLQDMTLPLQIKDGDVFLGPIFLMKIGKNG